MRKAILEFKEETAEFVNFLKNPIEIRQTKPSFDTKAKIFNILLIIQFLWLLVVLPFYYLANSILSLKEVDLGNFTLLQFLLLGCVIAPLWEEFVFRFPLRFKNNYVFRLINKLLGSNHLENNWQKNYSWYFFAFAICFGFIHAFNFSNEKTILFFLLFPLFTFSQISTGVILGYIRLKLGFWYGVWFHAIFNFLLILVSYSAFHNTELFHYKSDKVEIKATYLETKDASTSHYTIDEKNGIIKELEVKNYSFNDFTTEVFKKKYSSTEVQLLNFNLNSEQGITRKELLKILKEKIEIDSL